MNAPSIDIKDILQDFSSSSETLDDLVFGENLFIGREPEKPNLVVTIFDVTGYPNVLTFDRINYEYPSVQIRIRSTTYQSGWELGNRIVQTLHGRANETWNDSLYLLVNVVNGPVFLDWDESNRVRFIINLNLQRRNTV